MMNPEASGSPQASGSSEASAIPEANRSPASNAAPASGTTAFDPTTLALLNDIELEATLQFGSRELALREVFELGPGDVIELDRHVSEPVDLVVGDRIVARGEVVVSSGNFALRITEVAEPQLRLESIRCLF